MVVRNGWDTQERNKTIFWSPVGPTHLSTWCNPWKTYLCTHQLGNTPTLWRDLVCSTTACARSVTSVRVETPCRRWLTITTHELRIIKHVAYRLRSVLYGSGATCKKTYMKFLQFSFPSARGCEAHGKSYDCRCRHLAGRQICEALVRSTSDTWHPSSITCIRDFAIIQKHARNLTFSH